MFDLKSETGCIAGDYRRALPHCFGYGQTKTLFQRLLDNNVAGRLDSRDIPGADTRGIDEDVNVRVSTRGVFSLEVDIQGFGIVLRFHDAKQYQLQARDLLTREAVGSNYTDRDLPLVEAG